MEEGDIDCVSIRIKSASHRCEDLEFPCKLSSTVLNLKKIIQLKNPLHPGVTEQRLIYSGHLLDDGKLIRDVISANSANNASQSSYTFHLACTSKSYVPYKTIETQRISAANHVNPPEPVQPSISQPTFAAGAPQGGIPPDVLALHQLYVEQMMSFMAQWSQGNLNNVGGPQFQYQFPEPAQAQANANYAQVQEQMMRDVRNEGRDNPRVNEAARVRADDEENPRDMLDWMYTFSRLILVFSVVYFYSNFTRFFLVVIFTGLVMVMQRRHQGNNAEGDRVQDAADAHPVPQQQAHVNAQPNRENDGNLNGQEVREEIPAEINNVEGNKNEEVRNDNVTGTSEAEELQAIIQEPPVPARLNQLREIGWTFLTTFFTSLIPETPQN